MKRNTEKKRLFFCKKTIPTLTLVEISKFPFLLNITYSAVNNRLFLDMLSEIVFVKDKLYDRISADFAWWVISFHDWNKRQKDNFWTRRRSPLYSRNYRNVVPRFRNKIISTASIESSFETDREPVASFNKKSLRSEDYF